MGKKEEVAKLLEEGKTQKEISEILKISQSRVSQLVKKIKGNVNVDKPINGDKPDNSVNTAIPQEQPKEEKVEPSPPSQAEEVLRSLEEGFREGELGEEGELEGTEGSEEGEEQPIQTSQVDTVNLSFDGGGIFLIGLLNRVLLSKGYEGLTNEEAERINADFRELSRKSNIKVDWKIGILFNLLQHTLSPVLIRVFQKRLAEKKKENKPQEPQTQTQEDLDPMQKYIQMVGEKEG